MILLYCKGLALRTLRRLWSNGLTPALGNRTPTQKGNGTMTAGESHAERIAYTPGEREIQARRIVKTHTWVATGVGLIPLPFVDLVGVTAVQLRMLHELTKLYGVPFSRDLGKELIGALLGSLVPLSLTATVGSAAKMIPIVGSFVGGLSTPLLVGAATYAIGKVFIQHFETGGTLLDFEPAKVREHFRREFAEGQGLATERSEATAAEQEASAGRPGARTPRGRAEETSTGL
jgi:uncharacterized protein (DUF697 family)